MSGKKVVRPRRKPEITRYSEAFKLAVIKELESGESQCFLQRKYDIPSSATIHNWIKKYGKNKLLAKVVRVEKTGERDRIKRLEEEKRELEMALATTQIKLLAMESLVEAADEYYQTDLKKNFGQKPSVKGSRKGK